MNANPYKAYKQQSVMTMTPGQVLLAVYDEMIKQINIAKLGFEDNNLPLINNSLQKSQTILRELQNTLNFDYEVSGGLNDLYDFFHSVLREVNIKKSPERLDEVLQMVVELRDAFSQAEKQTR
ncbi:MAG: flagellar export chaperone FliS [Clostridiales bacterium]|nr:flagellar export chaperone FliS [Clostridiales bacterium]